MPGRTFLGGRVRAPLSFGQLGPDWFALRRSLDGSLVLPHERSYPTARMLYLERFDDVHPRAVVYCAHSGDVAEAIRFARRLSLPVAIRGGGHSFGGYSTTPGLVLDISRMDQVRIDASSDRPLASVGAGTRLVDLYVQLAPHQLGVPAGTCPTVGIAGLTLGGGIGMVGRRYGLTCDRLVGADVVLADGRLVRADQYHHPELFWALRGAGGGNFGVVTELSFAAFRPEHLTSFQLSWPWSRAAQVVSAWQRWGPDAPEALSTGLALTVDDTEEPEVLLYGAWSGARAEAEELLDRLALAVGSEPKIVSVQTEPYHEAMMYWAGCSTRTVPRIHLPDQERDPLAARGPHRYTKSDLFDRDLPADAVATLLHQLTADQRPGQSRSLELSAFGGAYNRPAPTATAFFHRRSRFDLKYAVGVAGHAPAAAKTAAHRWIGDCWASVREWASGHAYQNYIDPDLTDWRHAYYGANYPRLVRVGATYDPEGFFRFRQGVGA